MNKKITWGVIILLTAAVGIYCAYSKLVTSNESKPQTTKEGKLEGGRSGGKLLNVNALVIREQSLTDEIVTSGDLLPDEEVNLSFETSGKVVEINFDEGTFVKRDQLLAKVNDRSLQAQLKKLQVQLKLAEDRVFRQNALLVKDAVSKEAYEQVKTDLATLNAEIEIVKTNIALTELRAPFDGVIGLRQISVGAFASSGMSIAKLTKLSPLKIDFYVPEVYATQIKKGTRLTFRVEGQLEDFQASVYATEAKVDPSLRTLSIRATYPNTANKLLPGRYASIRIQLNEIAHAIAIPTEAIVPEMGQDKVYLYKGGKSIPVEVKKGLRTESQVQIVQGLQVGDTLITSGTLQLRTGLNVTLDQID